MPLTKEEQKMFEEMFAETDNIHLDSKFMDKIADLIFEMTGNVNLRMRLFNIAGKLSKKGRSMKKEILELLRKNWELSPDENLLELIGSCFSSDIDLSGIDDVTLKENLEALLLNEQQRKKSIKA